MKAVSGEGSISIGALGDAVSDTGKYYIAVEQSQKSEGIKA